MKIKSLKPNEIITTRDFPVHNQHILKIYFRICRKGHQKILPPIPVIPLSIGLPLLKGKDKKSQIYNKKIKEYVKKNKKIKYLMGDGSHKTTALALTHKPIHVMVLKTDEDIKEVRNLIKAGEVFSMATKETIKAELEDKARHLKHAKFFETVSEKTRRMVKEKVIPKFMIDYYKRGNN